jgi:asparagine synthase (glutamine-hydrolysing)
LKRAAQRLLPPSVLARRKQGFVPPIAAWLRGELQPFAREVIASSRAGHIIRLDYCQQLLDRHARGESGIIERKLWCVLCYLLWHEKFAN